MEEQLITFETAKLAKEKRFNHLKANVYGDNMAYDTGIEEKLIVSGNALNYILVPTQSLLQKWLREVHNIHLVVKHKFKGDLNNPIVDYSYNGENGECNNIFYKTYEKALEQGLQEALKLIVNK